MPQEPYNISARFTMNKSMYDNVIRFKKLVGVISEADIYRIALTYFFENGYDDTDNVHLLFNINSKKNVKSNATEKTGIDL